MILRSRSGVPRMVGLGVSVERLHAAAGDDGHLAREIE